MRSSSAALLNLTLIFSCSCSKAPEPGPVLPAAHSDAQVIDAGTHSSGLSRQELSQEAIRLLGAGDIDGTLRLLDAEENAGSADQVRAWYVAHLRATAYVYRGDLTTAARILDTRLAVTKEKQDGLAFYLRSSRAWLKWGQDDLPGALGEIDAMEAVAAAWPEGDRKDAMLHVLWDRAYLTLDMAGVEPDKKQRQGLLSKATEWRRRYEDAAQPAAKNVVGRAAIGVHFALHAKDMTQALELAKEIVDGDADPQDLFIASRAFVAAGNHEQAHVLRARIAESPSIMTTLVLRKLDALLAPPVRP